MCPERATLRMYCNQLLNYYTSGIFAYYVLPYKFIEMANISILGNPQQSNVLKESLITEGIT